MTRRLRVRLGETVRTFGDARIPNDRIVDLSEEDAAAFLRDRRTRSNVEILGWVYQLDAQLAARLAARFSEKVVSVARLPSARCNDVRDSCGFRASDDRSLLRLTCTITGSSYEWPWDGSETAAHALIDKAAEDTAYLIAQTPHYVWLRSGR